MSKKLKAIFLMDEEVLPQVYGSKERAGLEELAVFVTPPLSVRTLPWRNRSLQEVEVVFSSWGIPALTAEVLGMLPACRIILHAAGTVRSFATPAMWNRGVRLSSAAEANAVPVAEYTFASIIFSLKHAWQRMRELREGGESCRADPTMAGAYGSTVGLLSLSRIGRQVATRLRTMDVRVIAFDPVVDPELARMLGVELCSIEEVFRRADVISCHMPLLPETTEIIREIHFARMKSGATFINTSRGGVVCEPEMVAVLRQRQDIFAVLDVLQVEPIAVTNPLRSMPNVVLTPHIAGSLGPECRRMGQFMIEEAGRYAAGAPLQGEVLASDLAFTA